MENLISEFFIKIKKIEEILWEKDEFHTHILSNDKKYINYKNWLKSNGAIYEHILEFPVAFGKYHTVGAIARKHIKECDPLLYIPTKLIIDSVEVKFYYRNLIKCLDVCSELLNLENVNNFILTIFLITENFKSDSFYRPYLDMIEAETPILWEPQLLLELDDEVMISDIQDHQSALTGYYDLIVQNKIIHPENFSLGDFFIFYSFVQSRNFCVNDAQTLLVPLADSLNHYHVDVKYECFDSFNYICKYTKNFDDSVCTEKLKKTNHDSFYEILKCNNGFDNNIQSDEDSEEENIKLNLNDYFVISTGITQSFNENKQVFNLYGRYCNEYLLKWYGFCYLNNKYDFTWLSISLPKNEDLDFDKMLEFFFSNLFIGTVDYNTLRFKLKLNKLNIDIIRYTRFFYFYEKDEIEKFVNYKFDINIELDILNRSLSLLEMSFIKKNEKFDFYEDLNVLHDSLMTKSTLEVRKINILIFRISQKLNVLKNIIYIRLLLSLLQNPLNMNKSCSEIYKNFETFDDYNSNREAIKKYFTQFDL